MRITTSEDGDGVVVRIDGRLDTGGVTELERVLAPLSGRLRLDLFNLRSADEAGWDALRALRARGIALTRVSPFHRLLLSETAARKSRPPSVPLEEPRHDRPRRRRPRSGSG